MPACKKRRMMRSRRLSPILRAIRDMRISWFTRLRNFFEVEVHDKSAPLLRHVFPGLLQSHMRASSGPESVAGGGKGGIEDGVQHLQNHLLHQTIQNHWDPQLALSSSASESTLHALVG